MMSSILPNLVVVEHAMVGPQRDLIALLNDKNLSKSLFSLGGMLVGSVLSFCLFFFKEMAFVQQT